MGILIGMMIGLIAWFIVRYLVFGLFTVDQNERAVKTVFGRAERLGGSTPGHGLDDDERERYEWPRLKVYQPGGPYFKMPWENVHKVLIATETVSMAWDPEDPHANDGGTMLEAVTRDQLKIGLTGQIRYQVSESNLYPFLFGVKNPLAHVMGFFIAILRERIANFESPGGLQIGDEDEESSVVTGVSINDLRKNLRVLNDHMITECEKSNSRYGVILDASLITGIDPPQEVDSALAAINTAHNHVASDISVARADAEQTIVQSKRAVEIETLKAEAEVEPLIALSDELKSLAAGGQGAVDAYLRYVKLSLYERAGEVYQEVDR